MSDPATASTSSDDAVLPIPDLERTPSAFVSTSPTDSSLVAQARFILGEQKLEHLQEDAVKKLKEGVEKDGESWPIGASCRHS